MSDGTKMHGRAGDDVIVGSAVPVDEAALVAHASVRWGGIFAGAFTAILIYLILMALGLAVAGGTIAGAIEADGGVGGLGIGTAIWVVVATLIALFVGGWASGRVSGLVSTRVGRVQGAVLAAIFFLLLIVQAGSAIGAIGTGIGNLVGAAGSAAGDLARNEQVQATIRQATGDLQLRSPPDEVAQGIAVRLLRGDSDGARDYLAAEAGISRQEAQTRIDRFRSDAMAAIEQAGATLADIAGIAGWTLFLSFLLGGIAAMVGGHLGVQRSLTHPIDRTDERIMRRAA